LLRVGSPGASLFRAALACAAPARAGRAALASVVLLVPTAVLAQDDAASESGTPPARSSEAAGPTEEVVVFGRATELLGAADAASEGSISGADMLVRPMLRTAEMLETVPGMVAVQHSGSGKANQYFLRGFNLDHGTDFTTYVDGMPLNLRSHGHGQGYLDVNGLLPETVERIDYRKGPYRADLGDFSMAGASFITTIDQLDQTFVSVEDGQYGWQRVGAGGSLDFDNGGTYTAIGEAKTYDGPWQLPENLRHVSVWNKYLMPTKFGDLAFTLSLYDARWHPTEQSPERVIGSSICPDVYCSLDMTPIGDTLRLIQTTAMTGDDWNASAYIQYYDWHMQSNPTYAAQIDQFDKRTTIGGRYDKDAIARMNLEVNWGVEFRYDDIGPVGVDADAAGHFVQNISDNDIQEGSYSAYAEATFIPTDSLRMLLGVRGDYYDFKATANQPGTITADSPGTIVGSATDSRVSPKFGLAYTLNDKVELYGNWGKGFHSNDARGVVNPNNPIPGLSPGEGYEAGARFEIGDVKLTATRWWLNLDSELIFVGDSNSVEPRGASKRDGYELTLFWQPVDWIGIDAVYTDSTARFVNNPEGRFVDGSLENAGQFGISATRDKWEASMRVRYQGPYALTPDNAHRAGGNSTISFRGAYELDKFQLYAELINAFDNNGKDIVYWYETYVAGYDDVVNGAASIDDIDCNVLDCRVSRAHEPRTLRVGIKYHF
jgi:outer membrane receptor protein involved in Fe transport